ncbi:MAG: DinB family protein [Chloroflexia bacterium]
MSDTEQYLQDIIALHQATHRQLREEVAGLDAEALNWTPGPETSSIGTIIMHALGAETEMLRNLLGIPTERDRDAEFAPQVHRPESIRQLLADAEAGWAQLAPRLGETELRTLIPRPNKPTPQSGLFWLARNYGHLREHVAQALLTRQLYQMRDL